MPPQAIITAIYEDGQGVFWIGTQEGFVKCLLILKAEARSGWIGFTMISAPVIH